MAAIAGGTALGGLPVHAAQAPAGTAAPKNDLVKGYCPFCQVRCTYHARVRNGKILELIGDRGNRWTGGAMCPKGLSIVELLNSPYRLVQPMLKQGSEWKTISYAEAVDIVVDKLRQSRAKHGDKIAERLALMNINCLTNETNILNIPFPNAWNVEDAIIENPANTKLTLIILSAGIPIDNICSDALNIFNNGPGIACIITSPINIIPTA